MYLHTLLLVFTLFTATDSMGAVGEYSASSGRSLQLVSSASDAVVLRCQLEGLQSTVVESDGERFRSVTLPGEGTTFTPGQPLLPAVSRFVVVPPSSNLQLTITHTPPRREPAELPPKLLTAEPGVSHDFRDDEGLFPPLMAEMSEPVIIRGVRLVKVTVFPVRFDSRANEFLYYDNIETEVRSVPGDPLNPVLRPERRGRSRSFLKFIKDFAINGADVERDNPDQEDPKTFLGHYLIVTHSNGLTYLRSFIEWKRQSGYKVDILTIQDENVRNTNFVRAAIQIRYNDYLEQGLDPFDELLLVGDRTAYTGGPRANWLLEAERGASNWGGAAHADYRYACLEGDDHHPDVGFARWISGSEVTIPLAVRRTLMYEATPFMDDPEWMDQAAAFYQHWGHNQMSEWHLSIPLSVRWSREFLQNSGFDDVLYYENPDYDQAGDQIGPWLRDCINGRMNLMVGRAQNYQWRNNLDNLENNVVFPIYLVQANHGEIPGSVLFRAGTNDVMKGVVAECFTWGELGYMGTVLACNVVWQEMVRALVAVDLPLGWARVMAVTAFESYLPDFAMPSAMTVYPMMKTDFDVIGDPGLQPWIGVPRQVEPTLQGLVHPGNRDYSVRVIDLEDEPVPGVNVTFYAPGRLPRNDVDFEDYDGYVTTTTQSDEEGMAFFHFEPGTEFLDRTPLYITATGRDILPVTIERRFELLEAEIDVGEFTLEEVEGNGDGDLNPGELFALGIVARNLGGAGVAGVTAEVRSGSDLVEVVGINRLEFGDIDFEESAEANRTVSIQLDSACLDGSVYPENRPIVIVEFASEELRWRRTFTLDVFSFGLSSPEIAGDEVIPDTLSALDLTLKNRGRTESPPMRATLSSLSYGVTVLDDEALFPAIGAGEEGQLEGDLFVVAGSRVVVPGSLFPMQLTLESEAGFRDTLTFMARIENPAEHTPQGPDAYGYNCFDDTDRDWDIAPHYIWLEINPEEDDPLFEGELLEFPGGQQLYPGRATVLPLGFETQFYGELFDSITVSSNGFIAMGTQPGISAYTNYPLDRGIGGGAGMVAPFWTELRTDDSSAIYAFHDEDNGRFIVQWDRMRFAVEQNPVLTFQVVLYDREAWPSETGDQDILFQYKNIAFRRNVRQGENDWKDAVPYPSVGISSPDCSTGLSYAWGRTYPITSAPLAPGRALLFRTSSRYYACTLRGRVTDAETGAPVDSAYIRTEQGLLAFTDQNGFWEIVNAIAEIEFDLTVGKAGYNNSTRIDLLVREHDTLEVNIRLLHPEFLLSPDRFECRLDQEDERQFTFQLFNRGNGPLTWSAEKRQIGGSDAALLETRLSMEAGFATGDSRLQGVVFANDRFYLSGGNEDDPSLMYVLDSDGALIDSFYQAGDSRYGFKDLEWDGELLWGSGADTVYGFTPEGEIVHRWRGPHNPNVSLAWDTERHLLIIAGVTTEMVYCDVNGNVVGDPVPRNNLRIYGLAYWADDPDDHPIYTVDQPASGEMVVHKVDPENGDTIKVGVLETVDGSSRIESAFITNDWDYYAWVMMSIDMVAAPDESDLLRIIQIQPRLDWLYLDNWGGILPADSTETIALTFDSSNLPDTTFVGEFRFHHNAVGGFGSARVRLDVVRLEPPSPFALMTPHNGDTLTGADFDTTNQVPELLFSWTKSSDSNVADTVLQYILHFRDREWEAAYMMTDTFRVVDLDTVLADFQLAQPLEWWVEVVASEDTVECESRFGIYLHIYSGVGGRDPLPVEFGISAIYPSPFNSVTSITFGADRSVQTSLSAYDLLGRKVVTLYSGTPQIGYHKFSWDAGLLPSGIYLLYLESGARRDIRKVAIMR